MPLSSPILRRVSALNGALPSKACRTIPSSKSPSVIFLYSASALSTFTMRRSMRTPVWIRSTSMCLEVLAMRLSRDFGTNVPWYQGSRQASLAGPSDAFVPCAPRCARWSNPFAISDREQRRQAIEESGLQTGDVVDSLKSGVDCIGMHAQRLRGLQHVHIG